MATGTLRDWIDIFLDPDGVEQWRREMAFPPGMDHLLANLLIYIQAAERFNANLKAAELQEIILTGDEYLPSAKDEIFGLIVDDHTIPGWTDWVNQIFQVVKLRTGKLIYLGPDQLSIDDLEKLRQGFIDHNLVVIRTILRPILGAFVDTATWLPTTLDVISEETPSDPDQDDDADEDIIDTIDDSVSDLQQIIENVLTSILIDIEDKQTLTEQVLGQAVSDIIGAVEGKISNSSDVLINILDDLTFGIDEQRGILGRILDFISDAVEVTIINNIVIPDSVFGVVTEAILSVIGIETERQKETLRVFSQTITDVVDEVIEADMQGANVIAAAIDKQTVTEDRADEKLLEEVERIFDPSAEGAGYNLAKGIAVLLSDGLDHSSSGITDAWLKGFSENLLSQCDDMSLKAWIEQKGYVEGIGGKFAFEIVAVLGKALGILTIGSALGQKELAEYSVCTPWLIMQPGDAIAAYQRGDISWDTLQLEIKMNGYNDARTDALISTGFQVPDIASLYAMNLRGFPQAANLMERLKNLGFSPSDAEALADLKYYIPPPADLISMAVRDVFDAQRVIDFKQDQDFPTEFEEWAGKQGISSDWAHKYWQAHWILPSVQMAFEMLHRKVITEKQLKELMAAQDIIPGWRDQLIAISYSPYTRVDIRRMHKVGVLTNDQVFEAYQDIGYDRNKAQTLTDFTVALNTDTSNDDPEALEGLTRSSVINAYKDAIITRTTADELMKDAGIGIDAREIYLMAADLDIASSEKKDVLDSIEAQYKLGAMSLPEALNELRQLPLTEGETAKAILKLQKASAAAIKMPSKADLDKMFAAAIIDQGEYEDQLERIGYTSTWINRYVELLALKAKADENSS